MAGRRSRALPGAWPRNSFPDFGQLGSQFARRRFFVTRVMALIAVTQEMTRRARFPPEVGRGGRGGRGPGEEYLWTREETR